MIGGGWRVVQNRLKSTPRLVRRREVSSRRHRGVSGCGVYLEVGKKRCQRCCGKQRCVAAVLVARRARLAGCRCPPKLQVVELPSQHGRSGERLRHMSQPHAIILPLSMHGPGGANGQGTLG